MIKKNTYEELIAKDKILTAELNNLDHKIALINKNDPDYLDILYRQKFNYVNEDEIIIKLKWVKLDIQRKSTNLSIQ